MRTTSTAPHYDQIAYLPRSGTYPRATISVVARTTDCKLTVKMMTDERARLHEIASSKGMTISALVRSLATSGIDLHISETALQPRG